MYLLKTIKFFLIIILLIAVSSCGVEYKYEKAGKLAKEGKYKEAIDVYNTIFENSKSNLVKAKAKIQIAQIYLDLKEYKEAGMIYDEIIDNYPDSEMSEMANKKISEIESIQEAGTQYEKEARSAYGNKNYKLALEKYKKFKSIFPDESIDKMIVGIQQLINFAEREDKFNKILKNAKKIVIGGRESYLKIYNILDKRVYGKNEFERKRDGERAEADYEKITNTEFYIPIELDVEEYNFSNKTLSFRNIEKKYVIDSGPNEINYILFDKEIAFSSLKLNEREAESIKKLTRGIKTLYTGRTPKRPSEKYFVKGHIICKVLGQPESKAGNVGGVFYGTDQVVNAKVIDARIKVPKKGYIYMNY